MRNWLYYTWLSGDHIVEQSCTTSTRSTGHSRRHPVRAIATGGRQVRTAPECGHIYDHFAVVYEYPNGVFCTAMCRQQNGTTRRSANEFTGTNGRALILPTYAINGPRRGSTSVREPPDMYVQEHTDLIESIRAGKPLNELKQVAESTLAAILGRKSAYSGKTHHVGRGAGDARVADAGAARVGADADAAGADARRDRVRGRVAAIAALASLVAWEPARLLATGLASPPAPLRIETSAPHMGTLVRIVLYADTAAAGEAAAQAAFARIAAIDARLSDYRDDSEVAALSRAAAGVPVPVSEDLFAVLAASDALARRTGGAFDITAGRLTHLWRRARRLNCLARAEIASRPPAPPAASPRCGSIRGAGPSRSPRPGSRSTPAASPRAMPPRRRCACCVRTALAPRWSRSAATSPPGIRRPGKRAGGIAIPRLGADEPYWIALANAAVSTSATPSSG